VSEAVATRCVVEIRSYELKPGSSAEFARLVARESTPMLRRRGIDVVAFGPSMHDRNAYYLIRAYADLEQLERSEAEFYASDEWRLGPREAILACIDRYVSIVVEMDAVTIDGLRRPSAIVSRSAK
jgi:NIPSNAP